MSSGRLTIGSDIVDLADTARTARVGTRFDDRVFAATELARINASTDPVRERWRLWTAKEAAYKAALKQFGTLDFIKASFVVTEAGDGRGWVTHDRFRAAVRWENGDGWVHAVAAIGPNSEVASEEALTGVRRLPAPLSPADESREAHRLAYALNEGRPGWDASVSHDGQFVSAATLKAA